MGPPWSDMLPTRTGLYAVVPVDLDAIRENITQQLAQATKIYWHTDTAGGAGCLHEYWLLLNPVSASSPGSLYVESHNAYKAEQNRRRSAGWETDSSGNSIALCLRSRQNNMRRFVIWLAVKLCFSSIILR